MCAIDDVERVNRYHTECEGIVLENCVTANSKPSCPPNDHPSASDRCTESDSESMASRIGSTVRARRDLSVQEQVGEMSSQEKNA